MTSHDDSLMRDIASYNLDVLYNNVSQTGVKEDCIWHTLNGFHVTSNFAVDVMHDLFKGVCVYDLTGLFKVLVCDLKLFFLETLNSRIHLFNYTEIDNANKPPTITLDRIGSGLKMTASQILCLPRFLGLMIGNLVLEGLEIWEL